MTAFAQFAFQQLPGAIHEPGKADAEGLTKLITNLFDRWNLTSEEQLELLGLSLKKG